MWHVHNLLLLIITLTLTLTLTKASHEEGSGNQKLFLGCNWKCSIETCNEVDDLCNNLNLMWQSLNEVEKDKVELCINPPFVFLDRVRTRLSKEIAVGSQNAYDCRGPNIGNTGTTTAKMLQSLGCASVLLGHSDRRNNLFETNELISDKVKKALSAGLDVTLTIGELPYQRRWGLALFTLRKQLRVAMKGINKDEWDKIVIAYEPVWAVGEGATPCSPEEAQRINAYLRKYIAKRVSVEASRQCRLTYTGSVNEKNAVEYASLEDVQGFVVGRAGLDMTKLRSIIQTLADST